jgi:hypothetical protein
MASSVLILLLIIPMSVYTLPFIDDQQLHSMTLGVIAQHQIVAVGDCCCLKARVNEGVSHHCVIFMDISSNG